MSRYTVFKYMTILEKTVKDKHMNKYYFMRNFSTYYILST